MLFVLVGREFSSMGNTGKDPKTVLWASLSYSRSKFDLTEGDEGYRFAPREEWFEDSLKLYTTIMI